MWYLQGSRNDFVKYVDFGHDTPVGVSVYGADYVEGSRKAPSAIMRKWAEFYVCRLSWESELNFTFVGYHERVSWILLEWAEFEFVGSLIKM